MSDAEAAYLKDLSVSPDNVCGLVYDCLGFDPSMTVANKIGRPVAISQGARPVRGILA